MQTIHWTHLRRVLGAVLLLLSIGLAGPAHAYVTITQDTTIDHAISDQVWVTADVVVKVVDGGSISQGLVAYAGTVNVSGGSISSLTAWGSSKVNVSGGSISGSLSAYDSSTVNVTGQNLFLAYVGPNGGYTRYHLTGTLQDGTPIDCEAFTYPNGQIVLHNTDTLAPTTTATAAMGSGSPPPPYDGKSWTNQPVTVALSATDNSGGSGVKQITYSATGAQPISSTDVSGSTAILPTITADGVNTISFFATDNAGNVETPKTFTVQIDTHAPTTAVDRTGPSGQNGWYIGSVSVSLTANDGAGSGVAQTLYSIDGGSQQDYATTGPFTVSGEGTHTVSASSTDKAGNIETQQSVPVNTDSMPPVTTASLSGTLGNNDRYVSDVQVTLSASDGTSGVGQTLYSLDGGSTWQAYSAPFTVSAEASYMVQFYSVDKAGNTEAPHPSIAFRVDRTAAVTLGNLNQTYDGSPKAATAATDPPGLTVDLTYTQNGNPVAAPINAGSYAVTATINDATYNGSATGTLVIDPASAGISLGNLDQTYDGSPKSATASTDPAGLSGVTIHYSQNGNPVSEPTNAGSYDVVDSLDNPNYRASNATGTLVIRPAPAQVTLGGLNPTYDGAPKTVTVTTVPAGLDVAVAYSQNGSPVSSPTNAGTYEVVATINDPNHTGSASGQLTISPAPAAITLGDLSQVADGTPKTASATTDPPGLPVALTYGGSSTPPAAPGSYSVQATITDPNYAGTASGTLVLTQAVQDTTPPVTTASPSGPMGMNGWYRGAVTVTLSATDTGSGVASTLCSMDGGPETPYSGAFTVTGDGTHTMSFYSTDRAGNREAVQSMTIRIDGTLPALTFGAPSPAPNAVGWNRTPVSISFTAMDATSAVASTSPAASPLLITTEGAGLTGQVTVTDNAGNAATFTTAPVNIDRTSPTITATSAPPPNPAGWNNTPVTVTFAAADALSGVAGSPTQSVVVPGSGKGLKTSATFQDAAGNSSKLTVTVNIDLIAPSITCPADITVSAHGKTTASVKVGVAKAKDNQGGSGVDTVVGVPYLNGTPDSQVLDAPYPVGVTTIVWTAIDGAGNQATCSQTITVTP